MDPKEPGDEGKKASRKKVMKVPEERCGLNFPIDMASRALKRGKYSSKVGGEVPVYMTAVLEYVASEVLELAGQIVTDPQLNSKVCGDGMVPNTITPAHLEFILQKDGELNQVVQNISGTKDDDSNFAKNKEDGSNIDEDSNSNTSSEDDDEDEADV